MGLSMAKKAVFCAQVCVAGKTGFILRSVMCGYRIRYHLLSVHSFCSGKQGQGDSCSDDFHFRSTNGTGDDGPFFLSAGKHAERIYPQYHLKEFNKFFAARMKKSVRPRPTKTLWQNMEHEQIKELFSTHCPGFVLSGLGMLVAEGHPAVFASQDVLLLNDTPVEILPKIDDGLVTVANVFAMSDPLFGAIFGQFQALVNQGLRNFCAEDLCQGLFVEKVSGLFPP